MGSSNSKEKELNEDLERIRKERIARERAERERAERDRAERDRAERDRVANLKLILVKVTSPPGCEIEIDEAVTVRVFLEKVAPLLGLVKSDAPSLQVEFSETILGHELELKGAGMCDESLCSVLGVEALLLVAKAKNMDIVKAAEEGRIADVQLVLQHAPEKVNDQTKSGFTALHWAACKNSLEVAEVLVAANANVDIKTNNGDTALHRAAIMNRVEVSEVLVAANANVDIRGHGGETALHKAAEQNSLKVAKVLLAANANVDEKTNGGSTALHKTAWKNSFEVAEVLVAANANVDIKNSAGETALDLAKRHSHQAMVALLSSQ